MVCSPQMKRVLSALCAAMMVGSVTGVTPMGGMVWAKTASMAAQAPLSITGVRVTADGAGLLLDASRPFTAAESRKLSVLKFPYPYRLLLDIPNAKLGAAQTVIQVNRNGISRIELSDNASPFYSAVRAIIFVDDNQTLSRLTPIMSGNTLRLDGNLSAIAAQDPPARQMAPTAGGSIALKPLAQPLPISNSAPKGDWKHSRRARPLPPVTTPVPELKPAYGIVPPTVAAAQENSVPAPMGSQTTIMGTPLMPGTNVVEGVSFRDHRLMVQGRPGTELRIKNRFTLTAPKRLVLDIDNSVLASRALLGSVSGDSDAIRQVRVGQFDENTVRLVIETDSPEQFEAVFPGTDRSALAISPYSSTAITRLSSNTRLGEVESIDLKREADGTLLRLTASTPIVHRFQKKDNRVTLELLNESAHPTPIAFDSKQYPEIDKMRLEPLTDGQPNSKLSIMLDGRNIRAIPTLSSDGRVLEIRMSPGEQPDTVASAAEVPGGADASGATVFLPAGKAPFPARIVLDAGHGGKDIGANRSGVYEKDLNLSLALLVRDALVAKGFKVYMTRSTDVFLPLPEISAITNRVHPDLFVSIHHNASVNPALNGIETYYYTPQSIALARKVHAREINAVGVRDGGVKQARFYVIHHTDVPAILCEVGYVSNPSELDALQSIDRKLKTARSIADGVVDYLKSRVSASAK